jgi:integrase
VFARKADAQRFLTEMENSKLKGTWTNPALGRVLFREWFVEWQQTTARLRPNTEARDEWLFRLHVLPHFGPIPLAGIGQRDVRAWVAALIAKELAASTVQRCYQLLSKVMAAAVDAGMISQSPCRRVPLPKIERQEMRFLSPAEVWKLADAIRPDYRALMLLGAFGGLRIGEMAGLRIHDLRHTAVALWIAAGANPKEVAARAGHASVSFRTPRPPPRQGRRARLRRGPAPDQERVGALRLG